MSDNTNLLNTNNYNMKLDSKNLIIFEYNKLLNEYMSHIIKQLVIKDSVHYLFIVNRGFDLLKNIFISFFYYTKNLELTVHHLRKSYLYYTEFIGQVGEDSNSFLQLNSKDACLFVYKKTIYEINDEYKKNFELSKKEQETFFDIKENIFIFTKILKLICLKYIQPENKFLEKNNTIYFKNIKQFMVKIINELKKSDFKKDQDINDIYNFINYVENNVVHLDKIQQLLIVFLKKSNSHEIDSMKLCKLLLNIEENNNQTSIKFINKLFRK